MVSPKTVEEAIGVQSSIVYFDFGVPGRRKKKKKRWKVFKGDGIHTFHQIMALALYDQYKISIFHQRRSTLPLHPPIYAVYLIQT